MGPQVHRTILLGLVTFAWAASPTENSRVTDASLENATIGEFHWSTDAVSSVLKDESEDVGQFEGDRSQAKKSQEFFSEGTRADLEDCQCPFITYNYTCVCSNRNGIIKAEPTVGSGKVDLKYYIQSEGPGTVVVYFTAQDIPKPSSMCKLTVGDTVFASPTDVKDINVAYTDTDTPIIMSGYFVNKYCDYTLQYYTFVLTTEIMTLNATEGYLTAPADETGVYSYKPNAEVLWVLQPDVPVSGFSFTFDYLDLGLPDNNIHGSNKLNFSSGDFLVIGPGEDLLQGNDHMFYGIREPGDFKRIVTIGGSSHVYFTSTVTKFNASGFNISYKAEVIEPTTTPLPLTTVNPPPPDDRQTTYLASIEGAPKAAATINQTIDDFKTAMANMSSEYAKMKHWETKDPITKDTVVVYEALTCNILRCNPECVAFNFSVAAVDCNDTWLFYAPVMEDMLSKPELQYALENIGKDCTVCDEHKGLNLWLYIGIPVGIIVFALVLSSLLWYTGAKSNLEESRRRFEQELADRRDDNRRRSSGDISILGVGGSIASRGSLGSRRFTMPFPKAKRESNIVEEDEGEDTVDMSGFKEYDPDLGRVDPAEFGISTEFLNTSQSLPHYGNPGFVDDEGDEGYTIFRRGHSIATTAGTDSEDSDGGAVSFSGHVNKKGKAPASVPLQATADVHMTEEGQVSVNGVCGETAL